MHLLYTYNELLKSKGKQQWKSNNNEKESASPLSDLWRESQMYLTYIWHAFDKSRRYIWQHLWPTFDAIQRRIWPDFPSSNYAFDYAFDLSQRRVKYNLWHASKAWVKVWQRRSLSPATAGKGVVKDDLWCAWKVVKGDQMWPLTRLYPHLWPTTKMSFRAVDHW